MECPDSFVAKFFNDNQTVYHACYLEGFTIMCEKCDEMKVCLLYCNGVVATDNCLEAINCYATEKSLLGYAECIYLLSRKQREESSYSRCDKGLLQWCHSDVYSCDKSARIVHSLKCVFLTILVVFLDKRDEEESHHIANEFRFKMM